MMAYDTEKSPGGTEQQMSGLERRPLEECIDSPPKFQPSHQDRLDMELFSISPAFNRRFNFLAMVGFASTVVMCWQNTLATFSFALQNGGTGGYFFTYLYGIVAFGLVYVSLAELSSM